MRRLWPLLSVFAVLAVAVGACCQCAPLLPFPRPAGDVLTPAQEARLGRIQTHMTAWPELRNPALLAHLRAVGGRLAAELPPGSGYAFHYHLIAEPFADAFTLPGGQIFLSRALVALTQNDDELAGVLAHEMGHNVTHQLAVRMSALLLAPYPGATRLPAGGDLFARYNAALTWLANHIGRLPAGAEERPATEEQADEVALQLTARAGYDPRGLARILTRLTRLHPRSRSWLARWLEGPLPDRARLAAIAAEAARLPACGAGAPRDPAAFQRWRDAVIAQQAAPAPSLPGLLRTVHLQPALSAGFRAVAFSPDGRNLLVVGAAQAWLLRREPLAVQFRMPVADIISARFAPDGREILLLTREGRIEARSLAGQRLWTREVAALGGGCIAGALSPRGRYWACERPGNGRMVLVLTRTGQVILRIPGGYDDLSFSPSGRYLLARNAGVPAVFDLRKRQWAHGRWPAGRELEFIAPGKMLMCELETNDGLCWAVHRVPGGQRVRWLRLSSRVVWRKESHGKDYIAWNPQSKRYVIADGTSGAFLGVSRSGALDGYGDVFAAGARNGTVELVRFTSHGPEGVAKLRLPAARLAGGGTLAASSDLKWLGVSEGKETILWNLTGREQGMIIHLAAHSLGFGDGAAWLETRAEWTSAPRRARVGLRLRKFSWLPPEAKGSAGQWSGGHLVVASLGRNHQVKLAGEMPGGQETWRRALSPHTVFVVRDGRVVLARCEEPSGWLSRLKANLGFDSSAVGCGSEGVHFSVWRADSGAVLYQFTLAEPPWLEPAATLAAGRRLILGDLLHRVMAYDLSSGKLAGVAFGYPIAVSAAARLVAAQNGPYRMDIDSLGDLRRLASLEFPHATVWAQFSADGRRLLVLTQDQTVYLFSVAALAPGAVPAAAAASASQ